MLKTLAWRPAYWLGLTGLIAYLFRQRAYDDLFITFRYAENLANGLGFVYNPGQRLLSTTTPLLTLLLAALQPLPFDTLALARLIGAASLGAGALALWALAQTWNAPRAAWAALLLYPFFPLLLSTLGSEMPLALALCLWACACYARRCHHWAAVFAALAVLTRMDAALVPLLLGLDYLLRERRLPPWRAVILFVVFLAPWFIFSRLYFGQWLPATLATKQAQGLMLISQKFAPGFLTVFRGYASHWHYWVEASLALIGVGVASARQRQWLIFLAWPIVYFVAYSLLGVTRYFWYYAPLIPGFVMAAALGVEAVWRGWQRLAPPAHRLAGAALLVLGVALLVAHGAQFVRQSQQTDPRYPFYRAIGEWLRANTLPEASVGTLEVGIIGYYAQRPIVDFAGLIQPEVARQMTATATYADTTRWAITTYRPDYLALNPGWFPDVMQSLVLPNCAAQHQFSGAAYGYQGEMVIYQCQW